MIFAKLGTNWKQSPGENLWFIQENRFKSDAGMYAHGKIYQVVNEMNNYGNDVLGVSECRWA